VAGTKQHELVME